MAWRAAWGGALATGVACVSMTATHAQFACDGVSQTANATLSSVVVASGLTQPLFVTSPPGDTGRIFVVERAGVIKIHKKGAPTSTLSVFLDITSKVDSSSSNEMGLLGLAFDPSYATSRSFWVDYTETVAGQRYTVVARYAATAENPDLADPASETRVLRFGQPGLGHKGGMLAFGIDGFLYISSGDGGNDGGPCGAGQDRTVLLGKLLRIDVRGVDPAGTAPDCGLAGATYKIPSTNPFVDGAGTGLCDEIWAYGLRNPWRPSVDAANGDLYVADVGESCWEEIDWTPATSTGGQNYGWRIMEGSHCWDQAQPGNCDPPGVNCGQGPACKDPSLQIPVLEYSHLPLHACAITGGYVYRGCRMTPWLGAYFYGDYCLGFVRTLTMSGGVATNLQDVTSQVDPSHSLSNLSSFGQDAQGEIYAVSLGGLVRKIVPPFGDLEVSAIGSGSPFLLSRSGDWTWEDLYLATDEPVSFYRVYRGTPNGAYTCVLKVATPKWPAGGDATIPAPDQLFAYLVSAVDASGTESKTGSAGTFDASTCP